MARHDVILTVFCAWQISTDEIGATSKPAMFASAFANVPSRKLTYPLQQVLLNGFVVGYVSFMEGNS